MKRSKLIILAAIVIGLLVAVSCKHEDQSSNGPVFKSVTIQLDSQSDNTRADYVLSSGVQSALISVVPEAYYPITSLTEIKNALDRTMLDLSTNKVTLNVPLDTPIRISKITFGKVYTEAEILAKEIDFGMSVSDSTTDAENAPTFMGISEPFTVSAGTESQVVEVLMTEAVWTLGFPLDATTDYYPTPFPGYYPGAGFSLAMDPATITTNVGSTTCSGSIQISKDDFSTCLSMFQQPAAQSGYAGKLFYLVPTFGLDLATTYKIRVKSGATGVKSTNGSELSAFYKGDYTQPTGFTTEANTIIGGTHHNNDPASPAGTNNNYTGSSGSTGTTDDALTNARFNTPYDITFDGTNLFVADRDNHRIRSIFTSTGYVATIAGSSQGWDDNATGTSAQFNSPSGITATGPSTSPYLFVADTGSHVIRAVSTTPPYAVVTLAGWPGSNDYTDADGTSARFNSPYGLTTDGSKYLYVADRDNNAIRRISLASPYTVTNVAGSASTGGAGSTNGTGTAALFNSPTSLTLSTDGSILYVLDKGNNKIRRIDLTDNSVTDFAVTGVALNAPEGITTDGLNLYVSNTGNSNILSIPLATGVVTDLVGQSGTPGCAAGSGTSASFTTPKGLVSVGSFLYIANSGCHIVNLVN